MIAMIATAIIGIVAGGGLGWALHKFFRARTLRLAREEAQDILDEANEVVELRNLEERERIQEIEMELWTKVEPEMLKSEGRIEDLQEVANERKAKADAIVQEEKKKLQDREADVKVQEQALRGQEAELGKLKEAQKALNQELVQKLTERLGTSAEEFKTQLKNQMEEESRRRAARMIQETEADTKEHAESEAKRILSLVIDRFARPYCAERGIGAVNFPDAHIRKLFCDPAGNNIKAVQDACGCDIIVEEGMEMVGVAGFDPVRRELTRRTLERIFKEKKNINPDFIRKIAENQKKELFKNIKHDGDSLAKELKLEGLNAEIRQMMGSLRYRYSFTQNQYFHCGEVGWLAGLMAAELGIDIKKARRVGMLHDIGKSMDHTVEGGHAVIGADFIAARGEAPDVVHAVKAHHFDEQPSTDHAFLVIAADAVSGARPGARRSTIESYNQKVSELQDIARSFPGVTDCFVLSGGRECRVMVNGKKVDDTQAMDLSRKIAARIEEECNYPGSIKVVVVRETVVTEQTRKELA
ncbi:Rnase Y domain-containing protein [Bdellovibrio bacteriovorus]|uniref:Ribonuclease Y 2 n=1 Tax=Bdellovibrio bacteriovorus (strain ATCC 15356 / DSM 50701 / NCIMB 9529 / HD100) TaxID=264462 RepID=RNY2_BDEBA|nr:Rnase Y domain-containing protein [Bdellovibrio bacteriovorus]Q6ML54.1 RecName: Full=Ribonuclease Y 2; Short=RNase Y 2 [Bdellovibrio bacteriovorus HD100]CAE80003.1 hydrolase (HAD superfamily) [Bdellovibrio bacteriovorus HD100]